MMPFLYGGQVINIRPMTQMDYENVVRKWMAQENWNPGKFDAKIYFSGKGKYYYVLEINGTITAAILIYNYSSAFSFLGAYITEEQQRGKGYGKLLWDHAIKTIENECPGTAIGLYAVPAQVATYARSGFHTDGGTHRWEGSPNKVCSQKDPSLDVATQTSLSTLAKYDASFFPANREPFLTAMLDLPMSHFIFSHEHGKIDGFAIIRACETGFRIGPLYAKNPEIAKKLFYELLSWRSVGQLVFFDGNARNKHADMLGQYFQFTNIPQINCEAMYKGQSPEKQNPEEEYAVMSLELR